MKSKGSDDTLRNRRIIQICAYCACSKAFFAWRGPPKVESIQNAFDAYVYFPRESVSSEGRAFLYIRLKTLRYLKEQMVKKYSQIRGGSHRIRFLFLREDISFYLLDAPYRGSIKLILVEIFK